MIPDETVSVPEAAAFCGVSRSTINNWIHAKRLLARRSGRNYSIQTTDLLFFLESTGKPVPFGLKDKNRPKPLFRNFHHCRDYWETRDHGKGCGKCVVFINKLTVCFTARNSSSLQCCEGCHECRYYQEIFFPRIQFIFQMEIPAAVCHGLYFLGANSQWAEICRLPHEAFIGMDVERVIHPESLGAMISLSKKRDMGEGFSTAMPIFVQPEAGETQRMSISVSPINDPPGASLILGNPEKC